MGEYSEAFVAFDVSKTKHAVAIADGGRGSEVRFLGEVPNSPAAVERLIRKLAGRYGKLDFCYEAGPTGYGLYRQIEALGHAWLVIGSSVDPEAAGRAGQDQPARCGDPGAAASRRRADRGVGAGCDT
jgi:transposase